ncbi:hypothetical protein QRB41_13095 [Mycobacterium avium subsp. hominissuis]|uniref:hypothetical protein n=1 Tax=Mycobacterium avium TaxID=1764 RepID=UPI0026660C37|nr:hypothetical protein [Mycobacterium avium]MDO2384335.1 hypothetical protein [Mycobacterium avium subsp. hominissuis]
MSSIIPAPYVVEENAEVNTQLPQPHGWNNRYRLFGSMLAIAALGGIYFTVKTVVATAHGHWAAATVAAVSTTIFVIPTVWIVLMFTGRGRLRANVDGTGTALALATGIRWLTVWFGAVLVAVAGYLMFGSQMGGEFPDVRARSAAFFAVTVLGAVLGLVAMVRAGRRPRPGLRLSSAGVEFHDAVTAFTLPWSDVVNITGTGVQGKNLRPIILWPHGGQPAVIANASLYAPNGAALFWMIRYYWLTPAARGELGNGVALQRLRAGQFPAI